MLDWLHILPPAADAASRIERHMSASASAPRRQHGETYGEAKYAQDLYNSALGRALRIPCISTCPGSVDTGVMPAFFKPALRLFSALRAYLPGFNISARRGTYALLAAAVHAKTLSSDEKYVTWRDALVPSTAAAWPLVDGERARMQEIVWRWIALWRRYAADAGVASV